ncbi:lysophospholipid acyltransferase family protein [Myroides sp. LJL115]
MKVIQVFFNSLWRIWFYLWMVIVILLLSPFLLVVIWSDKQYPYFYKIARLWAILTFYGIGMRYVVLEKPTLDKKQSYMFIANHTSMLDIMIMLIVIKDNPFVFVGKQELASIPVFGFFYKKTSILVDRADSKSRLGVYNSAQKRIDNGLSICIFPEGGVPDDRTIILDRFKDGAFRLAINHKIPIVPISFGKLKFHFPFVWGVGYPGKIPVIIHEPINTQSASSDKKSKIKEQAYITILKPVQKWEEEVLLSKSV